ncbi:PAS domain S-box protein [Clostridium sp. P21]|uniref:PAS domain S-box protein n=1 Tax=Clostridium muellerianum TaxID=2716538 RepID=A0A7Y0EJR0_9CLOT|nr:PAS domain S-box protein [Clostridium muellerianum]NMM64753.1 PAS domain S-box protein [Clostridium muellerianum]
MNYELKESELSLGGLINGEKYFTECEVSRNKYTLELLEGVLRGIPDIIRVFSSDNTILFFNEAGYKFYNKTRDEVRGKKCFETLNRKRNCESCDVQNTIRTKQMIRIEKYVPEFNRFMECTYNPVLDDSGEIIFVVEQLKDITEKKIMANTVKESEERYRKIVNLSPEAIVIVVDNRIVLTNHQACKLVGTDYSKIIGESIYKYLGSESIKPIRKKIKQILEDKKTKSTSDHKIIRYDQSIVEVEISASYLTYKGRPAIQAVIRNITETKRALNQAAKFQKKYIESISPIPEKIQMETLYMPARTVTGDFFKIYKVNEDLAIGIVGDVSGKGITAALSVLAFFVLFREAILISYDPSKIVKILNKKIVNYLDKYIAACCFSLDLKRNEAIIAGAGINQFMFQKSNCSAQEFIVKGPFLGMFEDGEFDEKVISFEKGDRFYFPTDGLEFIFDDDEIKDNYLKKHTIIEFIDYVKNVLNGVISDFGALKDDSTLIALEIK